MFKRLYQKICRPKSVLFYRDFQTFSGGHQKVADYFTHLQSSNSFQPSISFSGSTIWDQSNPWLGCDRTEYRPAEYDFVFLAGMDWQKYLSVERPSNQPIVNLVQHVRHADPTENVYPFLSQRAVRICVSQQVADAIEATNQVNGPIYTIPNGVDLPIIEIAKSYDVVILGIKQPSLATELEAHLLSEGLRVLLVNQQVSRAQWFEYLAMSRIAVLLPNYTEGFYLPALEAMNYCDLVVVPDCVGNRGFCSHEKNCIMPEYNREVILEGTMHAIELLRIEHVLTDLRREMLETVRQHNLASERKAFLALMDNLPKLWSQL